MRTTMNTLSAILAALVVSITAAWHVQAATYDAYGGTWAGWPTSWTPIPSLRDPIDSGVSGQCDFVGDAQDECAYYRAASDYIYFRFRVHSSQPTFADSLWIFVDAVGSGAEGTPEYAFVWDTKATPASSHGLELQVPKTIGTTWSTAQMDDIDMNNGTKIAPPDFGLSNGDGYVRYTDHVPTANFGETTLVDVAVSRAFLAKQTALTFLSWMIQLGSRETTNDHDPPTSDIAANSSPSSPGLAWSSAFTVSESTTRRNETFWIE